MTSAHVLYFSTVLIGMIWIFAQAHAAKAESRSSGTSMKLWILKSTVIYVAVVAVASLSGASGIFSNFEQVPPPFFGFMIYLFVCSFLIGFSKFGRMLVKHTPLPALVGFHAFRFLAELAIYLAYQEGHAPVQMSVEGYNYDVVTATAAVIVGLALMKSQDLKMAAAFNWLGVTALAIIAFIAATSMPTPLRLFMSEPSNIWVTTWPYSLLPGVLVLSAITGHILLFQKIKWLKQESASKK